MDIKQCEKDMINDGIPHVRGITYSGLTYLLTLDDKIYLQRKDGSVVKYNMNKVAAKNLRERR